MPVYEDFIQRGGSIRIRDLSNNDMIMLNSTGTIDIGTNDFTDPSGNGYTLNIDGSANAVALYEEGMSLETKYALSTHTHPISDILTLQTELDTRYTKTESDGRYVNTSGDTITGFMNYTMSSSEKIRLTSDVSYADNWITSYDETGTRTCILNLCDRSNNDEFAVYMGGTGTYELRIDQSGNCGIGNAPNASYKMDVNGALNVSSLYENGVALSTTLMNYNPRVASATYNFTSSKWILLGTFSSISSAEGRRLKLTVMGSNGYSNSGNADAGGETILYASINNNQDVTVPNIGGTFYNLSHAQLIDEVKALQGTDRFSYEIYAKILAYPQYSIRYEISSSATFVESHTSIGGNPPTGTTSTLRDFEKKMKVTADLDVVGDIHFSGSLYQNGTLFDGSGTSGGGDLYDPDFFTVTSEGNVGIGITSPTASLHVDKDITGDLHTRIHILAKSSTYAGMGVMSERTSSNIGGYQFFKHDGTRVSQVRGSVDGGLYFDVNMTTGNDAVVILPNKNMGIGTTTPSAKLELNSSSFTLAKYKRTVAGGASFNIENASGAGKWVMGAGSVTDFAIFKDGSSFFSAFNINSSNNIGIGTSATTNRCEISGTCRATTYTTSSDRRIKTNIQDLSDNECLDLVRQLHPVKYTYIDTEERGTSTVYGFIAQDLQQVLPYSTTTIHDVIPDYMGYVSNVEDISGFISFDIRDEYDLTVSDKIKVRIHFYKETEIVENKQSMLCEVIEITGNRVKIQNDFEEMEGYQIHDIFLYGKEVDDFHTIKKDAIWTVATSALQEIDRIQVGHASQIQQMKTHIVSLEERLVALEALVASSSS